MNKINFTKEHLTSLYGGIADAVINNIVFTGLMGQKYNICEVFDLSINSLRTLSQTIVKRQNQLSVTDEWTENPNINEIKLLDWQKNLISLIIGYKLYKEEEAAINEEKARLTKQIEELENASKTPEDLIKENKEKLANLE